MFVMPNSHEFEIKTLATHRHSYNPNELHCQKAVKELRCPLRLLIYN